MRLATQLTGACIMNEQTKLRVASGITARGELPFLHAFPHNEAAIATYRRLGFAERRRINLTVVKKPKAA